MLRALVWRAVLAGLSGPCYGDEARTACALQLEGPCEAVQAMGSRAGFGHDHFIAREEIHVISVEEMPANEDQNRCAQGSAVAKQRWTVRSLAPSPPQRAMPSIATRPVMASRPTVIRLN